MINKYKYIVLYTQNLYGGGMEYEYFILDLDNVFETDNEDEFNFLDDYGRYHIIKKKDIKTDTFENMKLLTNKLNNK